MQQSSFDFYKNLNELNMNDLEFKTDFKYTIIHPYEQEYPGLPNKNIKKIEVTL